MSRAIPIKRASRANRAGSIHMNSFNSAVAKQKLSLWLARSACFQTPENIHDMTIFPLHCLSLDWVAKIYVFVQNSKYI